MSLVYVLMEAPRMSPPRVVGVFAKWSTAIAAHTKLRQGRSDRRNAWFCRASVQVREMEALDVLVEEWLWTTVPGDGPDEVWYQERTADVLDG